MFYTNRKESSAEFRASHSTNYSKGEKFQFGSLNGLTDFGYVILFWGDDYIEWWIDEPSSQKNSEIRWLVLQGIEIRHLRNAEIATVY
jgi:hypothetical protein